MVDQGENGKSLKTFLFCFSELWQICSSNLPKPNNELLYWRLPLEFGKGYFIFVSRQITLDYTWILGWDVELNQRLWMVVKWYFIFLLYYNLTDTLARPVQSQGKEGRELEKGFRKNLCFPQQTSVSQSYVWIKQVCMLYAV